MPLQYTFPSSSIKSWNNIYAGVCNISNIFEEYQNCSFSPYLRCFLLLSFFSLKKSVLFYEPTHNKIYNKTCATSEDLDQLANLRSLIRVFADRMCLLQAPDYSKRDEREHLPFTNRLTCVFAGYTGLIVGFVIHWTLPSSRWGRPTCFFFFFFFFFFFLVWFLFLLLLFFFFFFFFWFLFLYARFLLKTYDIKRKKHSLL